MPYYRRAAKRPRYGKRDKYSIQQKGAVAAVAANQTSAVDIVPATVTEGMRKVKHLTVNLTQIATSNAESNLFWALVYVPQGTTAGALNIATAGATPGSMYEPNQFVMNCGVVDPSAGPIRMSSLSLATSTTATRSLSSSVLLSMGRLLQSLLLFAMQSPSIKFTIAPIEIKHAYTPRL